MRVLELHNKLKFPKLITIILSRASLLSVTLVPCTLNFYPSHIIPYIVFRHNVWLSLRTHLSVRLFIFITTQYVKIILYYFVLYFLWLFFYSVYKRGRKIAISDY